LIVRIKIPRDHPKIPVPRKLLHLLAGQSNFFGAAHRLGDGGVTDPMRPNSPATALGESISSKTSHNFIHRRGSQAGRAAGNQVSKEGTSVARSRANFDLPAKCFDGRGGTIVQLPFDVFRIAILLVSAIPVVVNAEASAEKGCPKVAQKRVFAFTSLKIRASCFSF
jgi:hypothetical protein